MTCWRYATSTPTPHTTETEKYYGSTGMVENSTISVMNFVLIGYSMIHLSNECFFTFFSQAVAGKMGYVLWKCKTPRGQDNKTTPCERNVLRQKRFIAYYPCKINYRLKKRVYSRIRQNFMEQFIFMTIF